VSDAAALRPADRPPPPRVVERASPGVDVYRLALAGAACFIPGCELPASVLVAAARTGAARGYCRAHGDRAATLLAGRQVVVWPTCAVEGCEELGTVLALVRTSEARSEALLVCVAHT
jgi:hypothetical protein